jgi:hypothetical protein
MVALDLLARTPNLHLLRTVAIGSETAAERGLWRCHRNNTIVSSVAKGVFWPHEAGAAAEFGQHAIASEGDRGVRVLRGELFVPKGSKQSFTFPGFACRVNSSIYFFLNTVSHTQKTVLHCSSAAGSARLRPCHCARGSPPHRTRHYNDG